MRVTVIRRYPVKSMGGEALAAAALDSRGLVGDRWYAVADGDGRFASGKNTRRFRRRDGVFGFSASTGDDGAVVVTDGTSTWPVDSEVLAKELTSALGVPSHLEVESAVPHFDDGAVSLVGTATLAWCAERFGIDADARRLRANLVIETDEPFVEESWIDRTIAVGETRLRVVQRIERCRTIDVPQDGATARGRWLKPLATERDMQVAVYADVVTPGVVRLGDEVVVDAARTSGVVPAA